MAPFRDVGVASEIFIPMNVHRADFGADTSLEGTSKNGGTGGGRFDDRLRAVELDVREVRTKMQDVATKSDVDIAIGKLKIWALIGCVIGTIAVIGWLFKLLATT